MDQYQEAHIENKNKSNMAHVYEFKLEHGFVSVFFVNLKSVDNLLISKFLKKNWYFNLKAYLLVFILYLIFSTLSISY